MEILMVSFFSFFVYFCLNIVYNVSIINKNILKEKIMDEAVDSIFGERFSYVTDQTSKVTAIGSGRYSLNNPVRPNGEPTDYLKLVLLVSKNPGMTRKEIQTALGKPTWTGYSCSTYQALQAGGLIVKKRVGRTFQYFTGSYFDAWKFKYL